MKLGIVGKGNAGKALHAAYEATGAPITWWWSRRDDAALENMEAVDTVLIAVSDPAIEEVCQRLGQRTSAQREVWLHVSGSLVGEHARVSDTVPLSAGALHPLCALNGKDDNLVGCVAGIDGERPARDLAITIAKAIGMHPMELSAANKALYHAAAVSVAGHAVALFDQACDMLKACGFDPQQASDALHPLMASAVEKLVDRSTQEAMTGPIPRGDLAAVKRHLKALEEVAPETRETYRLLSKTCLMACETALDPSTFQALQEELEK